MPNKFQNKYRIPSARLQNWDYGQNAAYFITICTYKMNCYFGNIVNGIMQLSEIGKIVETEWLKTPDIRPDMNLCLGEFVVMPNHFHTIITIGENEFNCCRDTMHRVSTKTTIDEPANSFAPQSKNLASIIRGFKSAVTMNAHKINPSFEWQSRFYNHIIRNTESFQRIEKYIIENPKKWGDDKFYMP